MEVAEKHEGQLADAARFLEGVLGQCGRVAVTGRPGIGKSAVVDKLGLGWWTNATLRTDSNKHLAWDQQPQAAIDWARSRQAWLMEGVTVARALRHGLIPDFVLVLTGVPLRPQASLQAIRLGDQVYEWVAEARSSRPLQCVYWRVQEPKRC